MGLCQISRLWMWPIVDMSVNESEAVYNLSTNQTVHCTVVAGGCCTYEMKWIRIARSCFLAVQWNYQKIAALYDECIVNRALLSDWCAQYITLNQVFCLTACTDIQLQQQQWRGFKTKHAKHSTGVGMKKSSPDDSLKALRLSVS